MDAKNLILYNKTDRVTCDTSIRLFPPDRQLTSGGCLKKKESTVTFLKAEIPPCRLVAIVTENEDKLKDQRIWKLNVKPDISAAWR